MSNDNVAAIKDQVSVGLSESQKVKHDVLRIAEDAGEVVTSDAAGLTREVQGLANYVSTLSTALDESFRSSVVSARDAAQKAQEAYQALENSSSGAGHELPQTSAALKQTLDQYDPALAFSVAFGDLRVALSAINGQIETLSKAASAVVSSANAIAEQAQADIARAEAYLSQT